MTRDEWLDIVEKCTTKTVLEVQSQYYSVLPSIEYKVLKTLVDTDFFKNTQR